MLTATCCKSYTVEFTSTDEVSHETESTGYDPPSPANKEIGCLLAAHYCYGRSHGAPETDILENAKKVRRQGSSI